MIIVERKLWVEVTRNYSKDKNSRKAVVYVDIYESTKLRRFLI